MKKDKHEKPIIPPKTNNIDISHKQILYKNGTVTIPVLTEKEVKFPKITDFICLGKKNIQEHIRCIKFNGKLLYSPYNNEITWKISNDGNYIVVENKIMPSISIPIEKAVYTGHQCWSHDLDERSCSTQEFLNYLKLIA